MISRSIIFFIVAMIGIFFGYFFGTGCLPPIEIAGGLGTNFIVRVEERNGATRQCCPFWSSWSIQHKLTFNETLSICGGRLAITLRDITYGHNVEIQFSMNETHDTLTIQKGRQVIIDGIHFIYYDDDIINRSASLQIMRPSVFELF